MEANRKRAQVHMLPTEEPSLLAINNGNIRYANFNLSPGATLLYQHLYFTTDEEIKEGDWVVQQFEKQDADVCQITNGEYEIAPDIQRKIIASNDPKLETSDEVFHNTYKQKLPQPSQALIKAYCEQGGIDWVDVEYEVKGTIGKKLGDNALYHGLKVDPVHNTITTHRIVEKMYSREEVEKLLEKVKQRALDSDSKIIRQTVINYAFDLIDKIKGKN